MSTGQFFKAAKGPYAELFKYLLPYKGRFALGVFFGMLYGLTNGLLLLVIRYTTNKVLPDGNNALMNGDTTSAVALLDVIWICAAIPAIMLIRGLFTYMNAYFMTWTSLRVLSDIRVKLFARLMNQSLDFFGKRKSGDMIQTVFNQTRMAQMALTTVASDAVKQPFAILTSLAVLFHINWQFTILALFVFPLCIFPVIAVGKKVRKAGGKEEEEAGMLMVVMQEAFAGFRVVKSHGREDYEIKRFTSANDKMMGFILRWRKALEAVGPAVEAVASIGIAAALVFVYYNDLSAGDFIALNGGFVMLYPPFKSLSRIHILLQKCLSATSKVFELMHQDLDIADAENAPPLKNVKGQITFDKLSFHYKEGIPAVQDIDFTIEAGKSYALVGPSGAGKTTLFSLLMRFYDPKEGRILIDGQDIKEVQQATLRDHVGIVNQDTFLFHDTIYNNILYGDPNATREQVEEAARRAHAHDYILEQDKGYDTIIGDKGGALSGGQQQRLSIARAILRDAPILLLDEAMSALDTESEQKIKEALDTLSKGKTTIAIAHRLSTILNADQIVVMENGRVQDQGSHKELLERSPLYQRLYNLQFRAGEYS